ncbi:uncharacterized protein LOC112571733 [Pomacea canaliculata]|nr:uncharacterized protein LOC112571733 [Pomacea canaliculata]
MEDARTLSLSFRTLSPGVVGRYRCQASSVSTQNNVQGQLQSSTGKYQSWLRSERLFGRRYSIRGRRGGYILFLLLSADNRCVAAVVITLVICKKKACGFWKKRENIKSDIYKDPSVSFRAFSVSEPSSPTTYKEHLEDNDGSGEQELHVDDSEDTDDEDPLTREDGPEYDQPLMLTSAVVVRKRVKD